MIHQFAELGEFFRNREGLGHRGEDQLMQYVHDPGAKFRTNTVLLLVFTPNEFERIQVEQYGDAKKLCYLYRPGPPNGWDATPTSGMREVKKSTAAEFDEAFSEEITKKLLRLSRSIGDAIAGGDNLPEPEKQSLAVMRDWLRATATDNGRDKDLTQLVKQIKIAHPPTTKTTTVGSGSAIISVAWEEKEHGALKRVGDFETFQQALIRSGKQAPSRKRGIKGDVEGVGQCCICGKSEVRVRGLLQIPHFKLYTLDKPGSVSGGFDRLQAWRNFPACDDCCDRVDFAGERVKKELAFDYYGFKYIVLPLPVRSSPTQVFEFSDRLVDARVNTPGTIRLIAAEDEWSYVISQERNLLQVDLLFYQPDLQSFRPALYVSGLLPTRFKKLFDAKDQVDQHPWLKDPSPKPFTKDPFTFGSLRTVFPAAHGGSTFDGDFLAATRAALELRHFSMQRILQIGMRWVQDDYIAGKAWQFRLAAVFRSILFFEVLTGSYAERSDMSMQIDYGDSEQADRVRKVLSQASGKLQSDAAVQASFLVGACCSRIEKIQEHVRGASPFSGKLKGFRLKQADIRGLFVSAKDKAAAYGIDEERKVSGLLECAAAALAAASDRWALSPDEVSYFFALGHALRPRFAKDQDEDANNQ